jgi:small-conductance mechanosensitive channel
VHEAEEERLIEKLRKIEALFARATSAGERTAAENARDRIRQRLEQLEKSERVIEYRFSLPDAWSKSLFIALLRRYGIDPYRYSGQRRTTVMARVTRTFADEVLWPEYQQLNAMLRAHLESITKRVIAQAIHGDQADAEERPGQEPKARLPQGFLGAE